MGDRRLDEATLGLTTAQAQELLRVHGRNEIHEQQQSPLKMFGNQFVGTMPFMIQGAAILSACLQAWLDVSIIVVLMLTNAVLGFIEESSTHSSIAALKDGLKRTVPVKRDGVFASLDIALLVPGDLISLRGGDVVPADTAWVEGDTVQVDQAALTGESLPVLVPRTAGREADDEVDAAVGAVRALWCGTIVRSGECRAVVTTTGMRTMMGEAAHAVQESGGRRVGVFEQRIRAAGRVLIVITLVAVAVILVQRVGLRGAPLFEVLEMCISLLIASVPVALPLVLRVTLSVGAQRMAEEAAIVTKLVAMEVRRHIAHPNAPAPPQPAFPLTCACACAHTRLMRRRKSPPWMYFAPTRQAR